VEYFRAIAARAPWRNPAGQSQVFIFSPLI
jgi:hypothetical protein